VGRESTYIKRAPYFDNMPIHAPIEDLHGLRVLAMLAIR